MYPLRRTTALFLLALVAGCERPEFAEFTSQEGGFKALMRGSPSRQTQLAVGATAVMFTTKEPDGACVVSYADLQIPKGEASTLTQTRLDGSAKGMAANIGATLTKTSRDTLAGRHPGRLVEAHEPKKDVYIKSRIYLVGNRLYQVMAIGTKSWISSEDAAKFLNSFSLLEKKPLRQAELPRGSRSGS